jgi:hypothetical protein
MKTFSHDAGAAVLRIDIEELPQSQLLVDESFILNLDWRHFDLVLCLEAAQHVESEHSSALVESLVRHEDIMVFSATLPGKIDLRHAMNSYQISGSSGSPDPRLQCTRLASADLDRSVHPHLVSAEHAIV